MNRRLFLAASGAVLTLPLSVMATDRVFYKPGLAETAMEAGKVVFLDFWTNWCSTCAVQDRVIFDLRRSNPAYDEMIAFITVDWDLYSESELAKSLGVPRRSTLVVLKGKKEVGRIVAGTSKADIKALMDAALSAARA